TPLSSIEDSWIRRKRRSSDRSGHRRAAPLLQLLLELAPGGGIQAPNQPGDLAGVRPDRPGALGGPGIHPIPLPPREDLRPAEDLLRLAGRGVWYLPEPGGAVLAGGQGGAAVGAERHGVDEAAMDQGRPEGLTRGHVPEPGDVALAAGQGGAAVGAERHGI